MGEPCVVEPSSPTFQRGIRLPHVLRLQLLRDRKVTVTKTQAGNRSFCTLAMRNARLASEELAVVICDHEDAEAAERADGGDDPA
jgi:hypothetical protein